MCPPCTVRTSAAAAAARFDKRFHEPLEIAVVHKMDA
jgi:hypothetical protein